MCAKNKLVNQAAQPGFKMKTSVSLLTLAALSLLAPIAQAATLTPLPQPEEIQEEAIITDRPDVVESSFTYMAFNSVQTLPTNALQVCWAFTTLVNSNAVRNKNDIFNNR